MYECKPLLDENGKLSFRKAANFKTGEAGLGSRVSKAGGAGAGLGFRIDKPKTVSAAPLGKKSMGVQSAAAAGESTRTAAAAPVGMHAMDVRSAAAAGESTRTAAAAGESTMAVAAEGTGQKRLCTNSQAGGH